MDNQNNNINNNGNLRREPMSGPTRGNATCCQMEIDVVYNCERSGADETRALNDIVSVSNRTDDNSIVSGRNGADEALAYYVSHMALQSRPNTASAFTYTSVRTLPSPHFVEFDAAGDGSNLMMHQPRQQHFANIRRNITANRYNLPNSHRRLQVGDFTANAAGAAARNARRDTAAAAAAAAANTAAEEAEAAQRSTNFTIRRLQNELIELSYNPPPLCSAGLRGDDPFRWMASILGPLGSVYEGGIFNIDIQITAEYPFKPPLVTFRTRIYHCNINSRGIISLHSLSKRWSAAMTIGGILNAICSLLIKCNPAEAMVPSIARLYRTNRREHDRNARLWTQRYAS